MTHYVKIEKEYFVLNEQRKKFWEIRYNDRNYKTGDDICLIEYDPSKPGYTERCVTCQIEYVMYEFEGLEDGYVIMSLTRKPTIDSTMFNLNQ